MALPSCPIRIGIVDDDAVLARALAAACVAEPGFIVAGQAETLAHGYALVAAGVDVLLVDLGLPDGSGLDLIAPARAHGDCKVLVVSVFGDGSSVLAAIERGAHGYLLKGVGAVEAIAGIRSVLAGGAPISPSVARHILARLRGHAAERRSPVRPRSPIALTPREIAVLDQLAKGLSFKEVASVAGISHHTVADHVKAIYRKLSVNSRGEAVYEAMKSGLIDVGE